MTSTASPEKSEKLHTRCCVVGGGPAGMMLGLLLARSGVDVVLLEKHNDFFRDFRGDTIHPSTLELMHELGYLEEFLQQPHDELARVSITINDEVIPGPDFSHLPTTCKFLAFMPQWDFLNFIASKAQRYSNFHLRMGAEAVELITDGPNVTGVRANTANGPIEILADLVVGADGRTSTVRKLAGFEPEEFGVPIDVLWFRLPKTNAGVENSLGNFKNGKMLILINRGDYWQCGHIIPKGSLDQIKERGLADFRETIATLVPATREVVGEIDSWDKVKLLTVQVNRLNQWYRHGLLCIGDAAHAMSPVGGIGVNIAIQDAVATANLLADKLREGAVSLSDLDALQQRRSWAARMTQRVQLFIHKQMFKSHHGQPPSTTIPPFARALRLFPPLRRFMARGIGIGFRPEHIRTTEYKAQ